MGSQPPSRSRGHEPLIIRRGGLGGGNPQWKGQISYNLVVAKGQLRIALPPQTLVISYLFGLVTAMAPHPKNSKGFDA